MVGGVILMTHRDSGIYTSVKLHRPYIKMGIGLLSATALYHCVIPSWVAAAAKYPGASTIPQSAPASLLSTNSSKVSSMLLVDQWIIRKSTLCQSFPHGSDHRLAFAASDVHRLAGGSEQHETLDSCSGQKEVMRPGWRHRAVARRNHSSSSPFSQKKSGQEQIFRGEERRA